MRRAKRLKVSMKDLWKIQKELTGNTDKVMSMVDLANVVAGIKEWPAIEGKQPKYREFAKQYLIRYMDDSKKPCVSEPKCFVYFVQAGNRGPVKIGVADDVEARIKSMQTGNPMELRVVAKISCKGRSHAYQVESNMHKYYASYNIRGEWFASSMLFALNPDDAKVEWTNSDLSESKLIHKVNKYKSQLTDNLEKGTKL